MVIMKVMNGIAGLDPFREGVFDLEPFALRGVHCAAGHSTFPVRPFCATCKSDQLEAVALSGRGLLHTFTVVRQAPSGVPVPYVLGYVDLPEGVRLMSRIEADPGVEPTIGAVVDLVPAVFPGADASPGRLGFAFHIRTDQSDTKERHDA
jgi:uncharacterized OB-fold protein